MFARNSLRFDASMSTSYSGSEAANCVDGGLSGLCHSYGGFNWLDLTVRSGLVAFVKY